MNLSDIFVGGGGASVSVLNDQTFDTSGTWIKPALSYLPDDVALIELWGGGGGGSGGAQVPGTGNYIMLGGAGGAYLRLVVPLSSLAATQSVVVGAGGIGGGSTSGAGGDSSFNGFTAPGGRGGYSLQSSEPEYTMNNYALQPPVSVLTPGAGGYHISTKSTNPAPPRRSIHGGNGGAVASVTSGNAPGGTAPGGGGGANSATGNPARGGDGAPGRVRVRIMRGLNQFEISEGPL